MTQEPTILNHIGLVLDVSGSMKGEEIHGIQTQQQAWVRSVFKVLDDMLKFDLFENKVFAIGMGSKSSITVFDLIDLLRAFQNYDDDCHLDHVDTLIDKIFTLLENSGAQTIRTWASTAVVKSVVTREMAQYILQMLESDSDARSNFVNNCLPTATRNIGGDGFAGSVVNSVQRVCSSAVAYVKSASKEDVVEAISKFILKGVVSSVSMQEASKLIHGCVDGKDLTDERIEYLLKSIEPFIYGATPLYTAIRTGLPIFHYENDGQKLLLVLSDGYPSDTGILYELKNDFKRKNVKIVCCLIASSDTVEPKRLYDTGYVNYPWEFGAQFLFQLSSSIATNLLPKTIFKYWKVDTTKNETKLFVQINNQKNVDDVCELAKKIVCEQDALSELLFETDISIYINQCNENISVPDQEETATCYANAAATVSHLAMKRVLYRVGGYPNFETVRSEIIQRYGNAAANTFRVMHDICPAYRLNCNEITAEGALKAIINRKPVLAKFQLTGTEWGTFRSFFDKNKDGILTTKDLDISERNRSDLLIGHAVVLTSYNSRGLRLMNSWGEQFGDNGFFRVQNASVLDFKFMDVYAELLPLEQEYYKKHGNTVADRLMNKLVSLQTAEYTCPLCNTTSPVTAFTGTISKARCPNCKSEFKGNDHDNILALNIYLTSLDK